MSLSKTLYPLLSTGSTQEGMKKCDWDVKNQNKQTIKTIQQQHFLL